MANVKWSDHAMIRMREQTRYIAEQSGSIEIAWKWAGFNNHSDFTLVL